MVVIGSAPSGVTTRESSIRTPPRPGRYTPGSTVIVYPKVGHVPMEQIADRSAADLDAWLKAKVWVAKP